MMHTSKTNREIFSALAGALFGGFFIFATTSILIQWLVLAEILPLTGSDSLNTAAIATLYALVWCPMVLFLKAPPVSTALMTLVLVLVNQVYLGLI